MSVVRTTKLALLASAAVGAVAAMSTGASAGGFAIREQSAEFQGMSFAGNAAGGSLSAMFWNSAAAASRDGMNFESSYSILMPRSNVIVDSVNVGAPLGGNGGPVAGAYRAAPNESDGIAPLALVAASYGSYQIGKLYVGMGVNAPFGLATEPNQTNYKAATLGETTKLMTFNFNPTIAYKLMPGVTVGVGAQIQTAEAVFRFKSTQPLSGSMVSFEGNGWGFGATAGIMIEPAAGTTIGVGYRSRIKQEIEGLFQNEAPGGAAIHAKADLELPDIVTVSLRQVISPVMRASATFEWTNWSRFKSLTLNATEKGVGPLGASADGGLAASIPANWSNGYFAAIGGEYDYSPTVTLRAGFAYEKSPIDDPSKRLVGIPDADRYWLSVGASWKAFANTTFDVAYSHVFIEEARFNRDTSAPFAAPTAFTNIQGEIKSSLDIISASMKTRF